MFAETPAFSDLVSEMRGPHPYMPSPTYPSGATAVYIAICTVGDYPGSVSPTTKKVPYGLGIPGLLVSTILVIFTRYTFYSNSLGPCTPFI